MQEQECGSRAAGDIRPAGEVPGARGFGRMSRRHWLAAAAGWGISGGALRAHAHGGAAMSLPTLLQHSAAVVLATPKTTESLWEGSGRERRIVTYAEIDVHETIDQRVELSGSVTVRVLGGRVGHIGQLVLGAAELAVAETSVCFLCPLGDGTFAIAGMAQGHYRVQADDVETPRLYAKEPALEVAGHDPQCAVTRLHGGSLSRCERLVREVLGP